mgnify:FL=1
MKIIKKINNNVALGLDGNGNEMIVCGKGIGFGVMPYELTDLRKIDRTYYDIDRRYYDLLSIIPDEILQLVKKLVDIAQRKLGGNFNPNLVFILSDHINFAVERNRKGMDVPILYSYELEYEYPELTKIAEFFIERVNRQMNTNLGKGEVTSVMMHFLNSMEKGSRDELPSGYQEKINRIVNQIIRIVESMLNRKLDQKSFHYFRFKNHLKFFISRKERKEEFADIDEVLYQNIKMDNPDIDRCVSRIDDYLFEEFGERSTHEELMYLMLHIKLFNR